MKHKRMKISLADYSKGISNTHLRLPKAACRALSIKKGDFFHQEVSTDKRRILVELSLVATPTTTIVQSRQINGVSCMRIELLAYFKKQLLRQRKEEYYIDWRWSEDDIWGEIAIQEWFDTFSPNRRAAKKALRTLAASEFLPGRTQK